MMICGFMHAAFQAAAGDELVPRSTAAVDAGAPVAFVPQKAIVRRRLKWFGLGGLLAAVALLAAAAVILL
jgi:hypothetical protein